MAPWSRDSAPARWTRKITAAQELDIQQRYADGEPASRMALEYGITVSRVRQLCPPRAPGRKGRAKGAH